MQDDARLAGVRFPVIPRRGARPPDTPRRDTPRDPDARVCPDRARTRRYRLIFLALSIGRTNAVHTNGRSAEIPFTVLQTEVFPPSFSFERKEEKYRECARKLIGTARFIYARAR